MDQMRHAAKSNIGNVIRTKIFQGFIGSPFDPSYIYGCKQSNHPMRLWNNLAYRTSSNPDPIKDVA
jgi:hypothetical protein